MFNSDSKDIAKLRQDKRIGLALVCLGLPLVIGALVWHRLTEPNYSDALWSEMIHPYLGEIYVLLSAGVGSLLAGVGTYARGWWQLRK